MADERIQPVPLEPHDPEEFDSVLAPPELRQTALRSRLSRGKRAIEIVTSFLLGQGATQAIGLIASLFLVRKLSIEAYAQFGLATGFQTVFSVLMDLGFASTIVPLVGDRRDDLALVGRYVRAARHLRNRGFWILAPVASVAFLAIMHRHHWGWTVQMLLLISVLMSLYSGGKVAYFSAPLIVFGRLRDFYVPQVISGAGRLLALLALGLGGGLNAWTAAVCGALNVTLNGSLIRKNSQRYFLWPEREDPAVDRELFRYILPASPAIIFSAFQSQITLFLISVLGGTVNIAEVTALSRIGQLFAVLMTFNTIVVEPYVARRSATHLFRAFAGFTLLACAASAPVVLLAFLRPGVFLLILGSKYQGVRPVMGWYVLSSCISFIAGLIWIMNRARKWVFWSGSVVEIVVILSLQIGFLTGVGVHTTRQAVLFGLVSSLGALAAHLYVAAVGFLKGERATQPIGV